MRACVDIGGTKVAVSLAEAGGHRLEARHSEPTSKHGDNDALARQILRLLGQACAARGLAGTQAISAIGVASCGPFVLNQGMVELAAPNICGGLAGPARRLPNDWRTALLEAPLRAHFAHLPPGRLRVENDALAALEAERRWGALRGLEHCAYLTWSTGIGVGLCVDGRPLRGKNGNAGHAGHMFVSDDAGGALCGCGNIGDVEGLTAGNAFARRLGQEPPALLDAARAGDARARVTVDELCRVLGRMLYNLVVTLDLQRISIGGSVFWHHRDFLLPRLRREVEGRLPALTRGVELVPAGLGEQAGDYAALALVS